MVFLFISTNNGQASIDVGSYVLSLCKSYRPQPDAEEDMGIISRWLGIKLWKTTKGFCWMLF